LRAPPIAPRARTPPLAPQLKSPLTTPRSRPPRVSDDDARADFEPEFEQDEENKRGG
jgi:hypothetical protein